MKSPASKILLIGALMVALIGFAMHLYPTSVIKQDYILLVTGGAGVEPVPIQPDFFNNDYSIDLYVGVWGNESTNASVALLDGTEYAKFTGGYPLSSLTPLATVEGITWNASWDPNMTVTEYQTTLALAPVGPLYIVIENLNPNDVNVTIYLSALTPSYYFGLGLSMGGSLGTVAILAWIYTGWKRHLLIGIGANLIPFFIGIALQTEITISDFQVRYVPWVDVFLSGAPLYSPYLSAFPNSPMPGFYAYPYPPLFVLTLAAFNFLPGPPWKLALPLEIATLATGYLVFKIVKKLTNNERRASIAMLVYLLNPYTLIYGSYEWWNPSLFVLFTVLAFYLVMEQKGAWAMISLGIAIMYKQLAIVFLPLLVLAIAKELPGGRITTMVRRMLKPVATCCGTILAISAPFLVMDAPGYVYGVFLRQIGTGIPFDTLINNLMTLPPSNGLLTFNAFFVWVGTPSPVTLGIAYLLQLYILLGACLMLVLVQIFRIKPRETCEDPASFKQVIAIETLFTALVLVVCLQVFFPRGSYKYYLMLLTPFMAIFCDAGTLSGRSSPETPPSRTHRFVLSSTLLSGLIIVINRYLYFWILLGWVGYNIFQKRRQSRGIPWTLSRRTKRILFFGIGIAGAIIALLAALFPTQVAETLFIPLWRMDWA